MTVRVGAAGIPSLVECPGASARSVRHRDEDMKDSYRVLKNFAKKQGLSLDDCNIYDANVSEPASKRVSLKRGGHKVNLYAHTSRISVELKDINTILFFSINQPNLVSALNTKAAKTFSGLPIYSSTLASWDEIFSWLDGAPITASLLNLGIHRNESLHIYRNGIRFYTNPERNLEDAIEALITLGQLLPPQDEEIREGEKIVDGLVFDPNKLPENLRTLSSLIARWAVSDDQEREERVISASLTEKKELIDLVEPLMAEINLYLDGYGNQPLPNEAMLIGNLAELVAELSVSDA